MLTGFCEKYAKDKALKLKSKEKKRKHSVNIVLGVECQEHVVNTAFLATIHGVREKHKLMISLCFSHMPTHLVVWVCYIVC